VRLDDRKFGILRRATASRLAPNRIYKPQRGLNDICGSKAAASQLTRSAAAELSHAGIRLNCISPGGIVTGIFAKTAGVSGADADRVLGVIRNRFASVQPIPRAGETDDVAQAAVFLASDASSFITGQDIAVDGGLVPFGTYGWHESVGLRADLVHKLVPANDKQRNGVANGSSRPGADLGATMRTFVSSTGSVRRRKYNKRLAELIS